MNYKDGHKNKCLAAAVPSKLEKDADVTNKIYNEKQNV